MRGSRFEPTVRQQRVFSEVIDALWFLGLLLFLGGGAVTIGLLNKGKVMLHVAALVTALATVPGALYVVAAVGLKRRRYWAWVATSVLTWVSLVVAVGLCGAAAYEVLRAGAYGELLGPAVALGSWGTALGSILWALRASLPAVRQTEQLARPAFNVIPGRRRDEGE